MDLTVVGKKVPLVDGAAKVTGAAAFAADVKRPNTLYAAVLHSPVPHARLRRLDTSRAERLPGVRGILTARDFGGHLHGTAIKDRPVLAADRVRFIGEGVAVVAAEDEETAREALALIEVEYEEMPALLDPRDALKPEALKIHPDLESYRTLGNFIRYGNVCNEVRLRWGDAETAMSEADLVVGGTYYVPPVHTGYLEPHAAVAEVDTSGRITIWASTQRPFGVRADVAEALDLAINKVHVITTYVGGGFGGKEEAALEIYCAALARKTGRPVRIVQSRTEDFVSNTSRHAAIMNVKTGVKRDGTLLAYQGELIFDTGAYCETGPVVVGKGVLYLTGPYRVPNVHVNGYLVYTNKLPAASYRGTGLPQVALAFESQMDKIAEALGIDPWDLRWRNAIEEGDIWPNGQTMVSVSCKETLTKIKPYWDEAKAHRQPNRGVGLACILHPSGSFPSLAEVRLNEDGTVMLHTGCVDIGTGSKTTLAQIVSQELGVPLDDISVIMADTDTTPYDRLTAGSRVAHMMGSAVLRAAQDVRRQLVERAARKLSIDESALEVGDGRISVKESPEVGVTFRELAFEAGMVQLQPIVGRGNASLPHIHYDPAAIQGNYRPIVEAPGFATAVAEVEVDTDTGEVTVHKLVTVQDVGYALNPLVVEGQIEGALAQGLGYALFEEMAMKDGRIANPNLLDYRMATTRDAPDIKVMLVEMPVETGPYGAKGVGELGLVPVAPAVANAINNALGLRIQDLPLSPERIVMALRERRQGGKGS